MSDEAARRGPTSYTCFYARRGMLTARRDELLRLVRAIDRTEKWVAKASGPRDRQRDRDLFHPMFRPRSSRRPARATRRSASGARTPILPRAGYDRLRDGLVSGGFVSPGAAFDVAVDNKPRRGSDRAQPPSACVIASGAHMGRVLGQDRTKRDTLPFASQKATLRLACRRPAVPAPRGRRACADRRDAADGSAHPGYRETAAPAPPCGSSSRRRPPRAPARPS